MTRDEALGKITALLVTLREYCGSDDTRQGFLTSTKPSDAEANAAGLGKLGGWVSFDRTEEGLDAMRDAFGEVIDSITNP